MGEDLSERDWEEKELREFGINQVLRSSGHTSSLISDWAQRNLGWGTEMVPLCGCVLSRVWLFATPWTVAHQAPLSMEFSRQEYWSGVPFPSPGHLPNPRIEPVSLASPALAGANGKPKMVPLSFDISFFHLHVMETPSESCGPSSHGNRFPWLPTLYDTSL